MLPPPREFRLLQNIADALEAGRQRLEIGCRPQALHAHQPRFQIHQVAPAGRHAGIHFVVREAAVVFEIELHAVGEEIDQRPVAFQKIEQRQFDLALHQNLHHALRRAPQRKRVARAGGDHAHSEAAAQGVELVGQRDDLAGAMARDAIFHALGLVLVVDRLPHGLGFALHAGVQAAHHALQFGEFLHQFSGEVAFGKLGRADGVIVAAQFLHQRLHALGLFEIRAQLGLEGDVGEVRDAARERLFLIGLPEEAGVVEAGAQYAFVAAPHEAFGVGGDIHHRHEARRQLAVAVFHREVFLVVAHHRDQHFFRQRQELRVEAAGDGGGIFGDVDQRFEQRCVGLHRDAGQFAADFFAPLFGRKDHVMVAQPLLVIGGGNGNLARAQTPVAAGQRAGMDARQFERHDFLAQQRHDPADRPDEARSALDGPVHRLGEIDLQDDGREALRPEYL